MDPSLTTARNGRLLPPAEHALAIVLASGQLQPYLSDGAVSECSHALRTAYVGGKSYEQRLWHALLKCTGVPAAQCCDARGFFAGQGPQAVARLEGSILLVRALVRPSARQSLHALQRRRAQPLIEPLLRFVAWARGPGAVGVLQRRPEHAEPQARRLAAHDIIRVSNADAGRRLANAALIASPLGPMLTYLGAHGPMPVYIGALVLINVVVGPLAALGAGVVCGATACDIGLRLEPAQAHAVHLLRHPQLLLLRDLIAHQP